MPELRTCPQQDKIQTEAMVAVVATDLKDVKEEVTIDMAERPAVITTKVIVGKGDSTH